MRLTLGTSPPSSTSSCSRIYLLRCAFPRAPGGGDRSRRLNRHTPSITVSLVSLSRRSIVDTYVNAGPKIITTVIVEMSSIPILHLGKRGGSGGARLPGDGKGWLRQFSTYSSAGEGERERRRTNSTPSAGIWQVTALVASVPSCSNARGPTITVQSVYVGVSKMNALNGSWEVAGRLRSHPIDDDNRQM